VGKDPRKEEKVGALRKNTEDVKDPKGDKSLQLLAADLEARLGQCK